MFLVQVPFDLGCTKLLEKTTPQDGHPYELQMDLEPLQMA